MTTSINHINIDSCDAWLDYNVSFVSLYGGIKSLIRMRIANKKVTEMIWINCRLKIQFDELYNPKTPILIWIN